MATTLEHFDATIQSSYEDILGRYGDGAEISGAIFNDLSGLDLSLDVTTALQSYVAPKSETLWDRFYSNTGSHTEQALHDMFLGYSAAQLLKQKDLSLTIVKQVKLNTTVSLSIEEAFVDIANGQSQKVYLEKSTGKLIVSEVIHSETTHIPYGKILAGLGKAVEVYAIVETLKDYVVASYNAATGQGDTFTPVKEYLVMSTAIVAATAMAASASTALVSIAGSALVGGITGATVKTLIESLPDFIAAAKTAGRTLQETLDDVRGHITEAVSDTWSQTGQAAQDSLAYGEEVLENIVHNAGQLADDYGWGLAEVADYITTQILPQITIAEAQPVIIFQSSPLVLDLDNNGINLTALNAPGAVYWDIDQDGMAEASGWVGAGDGLLAFDRNADGIIASHDELFGTETTDGFVVLSELDTNSDNKITAADTDFANLRVWTDANGDGASQAGELRSLESHGITEISLAYSAVTGETIAGNTISTESTFTRADSSTGRIVDAWFTYDNVNTTYAQDYTLDIRTLFLPTLRGYGNMPDLHIAMSLDEDLLGMVGDVATHRRMGSITYC